MNMLMMTALLGAGAFAGMSAVSMAGMTLMMGPFIPMYLFMGPMAILLLFGHGSWMMKMMPKKPEWYFDDYN